MSIEQRLKDLALLPGPSGYEDCVGRYLTKCFQQYADRVWTDTAGNLTAYFPCGKTDAKRVMICAHMDSLGLIVKKIESNGYLRFERLGGVPEKTLPALEVLVRTEDGRWLPGVIGNKSHHLTDASEKYKVIPYQELYIDVGLGSADDVHAAGIEIGCPIVWRPRWERLGNDCCYGTTMDDRAGCAVLLEIAQRLHDRPCHNVDVYLTATVQEEFNIRGGMVAAGAIHPNYVIALDVALCGDTPDTEGKLPVAVGKGPVIGMYNFHGRGTLNGTIPHPRLVSLAKEAAASTGIPVQRFASCGMLTDAAYVQIVNDGIPAIDLAFACRYTHTSVEVCSLHDLLQLSDLVEGVVRLTPDDIDLRRCYEQ